MAMDFSEKVQEANKRIPNMEKMLGKGLLQPFNNTNAGARKLMHSTHRDHIFPLMNGEKAIVETGYEIRFGDLSSSVTSTDSNYKVVAKISKFSFSPNHHYYLIMENTENKMIDVVERISYHHITESYGYLYNNEYLDSINVGQFISKDTILQKSLAFDEYNNRKDGVNFNVAYIAMDQNMEDSIIFSDVAASKLSGPLIKPVTIMINENDIPLNIYGNNDMYKCIPDIGEDIKDSILIALRKEKKEESIYAQSVEHLKKPMMSDKKYTLTGKVIDINIYCNNPDNLNNYYNSQFKLYYDELQRMANEIVYYITPYVSKGYKLGYDLQKLYATAKRIMNKDQYISKRQFSNIVLEVVVLEEKKLEEGDKASNRYGGKGIVSKILPQNMMPKFGDNEYVDVIFNPYTMPNRENPGQCFEISITHVGCAIVKEIATGKHTIDECMDMIYRYLAIVSPEQGKALKDTFEIEYNENDKLEAEKFLLESMIYDGCIQVSIKPISESFDIDRLDMLYREFPWAVQNEVTVPIIDSEGNIRRVKTRRPMVIGKQYIFRLKQYAEEKFSATSLSSTNIRNENTKSKSNRDYMELHRNTPIRFGNMEINDMNHLGADTVITTLMIHSVSPKARRSVEQMYMCNPYTVDIKLGEDAKNRSAEIVNTYLKTIGKRLVFIKRKKKYTKPVTFNAVTFNKPFRKTPIFFKKEEGFSIDDSYRMREELQNKIDNNPNSASPITFLGIDLNRNDK